MLEPEQIIEQKQNVRKVSNVASLQQHLLAVFDTYNTRDAFGYRAPSNAEYSFISYGDFGDRCLKYVASLHSVLLHGMHLPSASRTQPCHTPAPRPSSPS
jgi:hypothetical protein